MIVDPLLESALLVRVVDDVAVRLHDIGIDTVDELHDLPRVPVGQSDETDLSLVAKVVHRFQRRIEILIVRSEITVMEVVEVDDVGLQIPEGLLGMLAHELRVVPVSGRSFHPAELRREKNRLARDLPPRLADQRLGAAVAVDVGRVPMRDAVPIRGDERLFRGAIIVTAPPDRHPFLALVRPSVTPRAEADGGDLNVGSAETNRTHGRRF